MTEFNGTVADLAQDVGEALAALHKVIWGMRDITAVSHAIRRCEAELQLVENVAHRLKAQP